MALIRWQRPDLGWTGVQELEQLREEMDRLLDMPFFGESTGTQFFREWAPAVDLFDDRDHLTIRAEIPGMKKENIDVSLHEGALTISGERKMEKKHEEGGFRAERFYGRFQRTVTLPAQVDSEKVKASYTDGVLTITLPKAETAKPRQIAIKTE